MKILKRLLLFVLVILIIIASISGISGYSFYQKALKEKSLSDRVSEVQSDSNFVKITDMNKDYINAVIAVEDHRFYSHGAIDFISIGRAIYSNIKNKDLIEGGSTITQQVSKNIIFTQEKTALRKFGEFFGAIDLENNYSKDEIFELYVNTAYFGNGYYGIKEASAGFYNKEPKDLTLAEASMLAGVPNAPSIYAPTNNPDLAKQRQQQVLKRMVKYEYITQEQADNA